MTDIDEPCPVAGDDADWLPEGFLLPEDDDDDDEPGPANGTCAPAPARWADAAVLRHGRAS